MPHRRERDETTGEALLAAHVERALAPLKGILSAKRLALVREVLSEVLSFDPVVEVLVASVLSRGRRAHGTRRGRTS